MVKVLSGRRCLFSKTKKSTLVGPKAKGTEMVCPVPYASRLVLSASSLLMVQPLFSIGQIPIPVVGYPGLGLKITLMKVPFGRSAAIHYFPPAVQLYVVSDSTFNNEFTIRG